MGPIQASLNQLTGSIFGGIRDVAIAGKVISKVAKESSTKAKEAAKPEEPKSETADFQKQLQMASPRIKGVSPRGSRKYSPADLAAESGNMAIAEKSRSASFDIATRLSMLTKNEEKKEGGKE